MTGRLIAVVGPSGVGKDSVLAGLVAAMPALHLVKRTITRAPDLGGEAYDAVSVDRFHQMDSAGAFAVSWGAHGLYYGIPASVRTQVEAGSDCLANFSRSALLEASQAFARFLVLNITARPETLAKRLAGRGRETAAEIETRLAQADKPLPQGLTVLHVANDGALEDTVAEARAQLERIAV